MIKLNRALTRSKKMIMAICAAFIAVIVIGTPVYAANTTDISGIIDSVISFLAWGVGGIGGFLAIFGIVTLGMVLAVITLPKNKRVLSGLWAALS